MKKKDPVPDPGTNHGFFMDCHTCWWFRNPLSKKTHVVIYETLMKHMWNSHKFSISTAAGFPSNAPYQLLEGFLNHQRCSQVMSTFASRVVQECLKKPVWPLAEATVFRWWIGPCLLVWRIYNIYIQYGGWFRNPEITRWGIGSWDPICLQGFGTSQVVVWDFWTINRYVIDIYPSFAERWIRTVLTVIPFDIRHSWLQVLE